MGKFFTKKAQATDLDNVVQPDSLKGLPVVVDNTPKPKPKTVETPKPKKEEVKPKTDEWWTAFQPTKDWGVATGQFKTLQAQGLVPKEIKNFGDLIKERKKYEKGSTDYNSLNTIVNAAYGNNTALTDIRKVTAPADPPAADPPPADPPPADPPAADPPAADPPKKDNRKTLGEWFAIQEKLEKKDKWNPQLKPVKYHSQKASEKWDDPVPMKDWTHPDDKILDEVKQNYRNRVKTIIKNQGIK